MLITLQTDAELVATTLRASDGLTTPDVATGSQLNTSRAHKALIYLLGQGRARFEMREGPTHVRHVWVAASVDVHAEIAALADTNTDRARAKLVEAIEAIDSGGDLRHAANLAASGAEAARAAAAFAYAEKLLRRRHVDSKL